MDMIAIRRNLMTQGGLVEATATGNPVTFSTSVAKPLVHSVIGIEPVQDLHGYDNPWPEGGGANQWDEQWELGSINGDNGDKVSRNDSIRSANFINITAGMEYRFLKSENTNRLYFYWYTADSYISYDSFTTYSKAATAPEGATRCMIAYANTTTYSSGVAVNYPATVTTYSPYSNICPITGWTGANIWHTGENIVNTATPYKPIAKDAANAITSKADLIAGIKAGQMLFYGLATDNTTGAITYNVQNPVYAFIPAKANTQYYAQLSYSGGTISAIKKNPQCYDADLNYIDSASSSSVPLTVVTTPNNPAVAYMVIYCHNYAQGSSQNPWSITDLINTWQIVVGGSAPATYSSYTGQSYPVTFPAVGKNLFGGMVMANAIATNVRDAVIDTTAKTVTFSSGKATYGDLFTDFDPTKRYTFILTLSNNYDGHAATNLGIIYSDGVRYNFEKSGTSKQTIVLTSLDSKAISALVYSSQLGTTTIYYEESGIFEGLKTAADFEPYTNTVYGGTVDLATGTLTVDRVCVDLGTITTWSTQQTGENYFWQAVISNKKNRKSAGTLGNSCCSELQQIVSTSSSIRDAVANSLKRFSELLSDNSGGIVITGYDTTITPEEFADLMSGIQFVYELATPITYQLTSQQITALKGDNTLWSNINDTNTVTYLKKK